MLGLNSGHCGMKVIGSAVDTLVLVVARGGAGDLDQKISKHCVANKGA